MATAINYLSPSTLVRATFPNRSFGEVFLTSAVSQLSGAQRTSLGVLADVVSDIKLTRETPAGFDSIKELAGAQYVGYIIDKERLNRKTGEWIRTDEYRLIGAESNSFLDSRIAYGEIYRYRLKTVVRITKREIITETVKNNSLQNAEVLIKQRLNEEIAKHKELFLNTNSIINRGINPKSKAQQPVEVKLFADFVARFSNDRIEIFQTSAPVSANSRTAQNSKVTHLNILGRNFNVYLPIINTTITTQREVYKSHYYESLPSMEWTYVDIYEDVPPPPPESIKITPNTLSNQIIISWLKPSASQRDIKSYKIYRRNAFTQPWTLLTELTELDINSDGIPDGPVVLANSSNLYVDKNIVMNQSYIYAISCVDIHGIESFLSIQVQAQLNPNFALEKEEKPLKWISGSGAKLDETNFVYKKFLNRTEQIIAKKNVRITPNSKFNETKRDFIVKVRSLDTHEVKEYKLTIKNEKV